MTKELQTGINGKGETVWFVITAKNGVDIHVESFDTQAEALSWIKWA